MIEEVRRAPLAYLATPYTKYEPGIEQAFIDASKLAAKLLQAGIKVYSPIAHCHPIAVHGKLDPLDVKLWIAFDESMMSASSVLVVALMQGWRQSYGVKHEMEFFDRARKPIYWCDPETLILCRASLTEPLPA